MLEIHLLGNVEILNGDELLPPFPTQRSKELFAILAARPNHPHARLTLAGNLWPEKSEEKARASLNTELWRVRQVLGKADSILELTRDTVSLKIPIEQMDIHKFRALVKRGDAQALREAVSLYRGEFIEGCYADWCLLEREALADQFRLALEGLLRHSESRGELSEAVSFAKKLHALDPLREEIHRALMRLYAALGDRPAALAQYHACKAILRRELNVEPMPETEALFKKISQRVETDAEIHSPVRPEKVFVGRAPALQWLDTVWAQALKGQARAAFVTGESGIGKTRLVERWLDGLQGQAVILRGRCYEVQRRAAFHPIRAMLQEAAREYGAAPLENLPRAMLSDLANLAPEIKLKFPRAGASASLPPAPARERLMEALSRGALAYAGDERPLVLFFDDLQWADNESLDWIANFSRVPARPPTLIVAACRADALASAEAVSLDSHLQRAGAETLRLDTLSKSETVELVRALGGLSESPGRFAEQVHAETDGNPLLIVESLRGLFDAGYLSEDADGGWAIPLDRQREDAVRLPLPASLRDVIRKRVERLTEGQRRLLLAAAALESECGLESLLAISEMEASACRDALRVLVRHGLVAESNGGFVCSHARVRGYLVDGLTEAERRDLHLRVACYLEGQAERPLERLGFHYQQSGETERALICYEQAGDRDMNLHAYKAAATHFEAALSFLRPEGNLARRFGALMKLYTCLWATRHNLPQLETILEEAHRVAKIEGSQAYLAKAALHRGVNLVSQGKWEQALLLLHEAIQHAVACCPDVEMNARLEIANILQYKNERREARAHLQKALPLALRLNDLRAEARARWDLDVFDTSVTSQENAALEMIERAFETNTPAILIDLGSSFVGAFVRAGDPGEALRQAERLLAFGREQGINVFVKTIQRAFARVHVEIGQYEDALRLAKEAVTASRLTDYRYGEMRALACMGMSNAGLGYFDDALQDLARAAALCEQMDSKMDLAAIHVEMASALLQNGGSGRLPAAEALARNVLEEGEGAGRFGFRVFALRNLARVRLAQGLLQDALGFSEQAVSLMEGPANRDIAPDPRVYFTHFTVLRTLGHASARDFLGRARVILAGRAQSLPPHLRRSYLRRVREHREICEAKLR